MSAALTVDSITSILGRQVDEIHLTVAKSNVYGLDADTIASTLGIERAEIEELMATQDYKDVRLLVGAEEMQNKLARDGGWDGIENTALSKLSKRVSMENDTETLLKIAAISNKAIRRTAPKTDHVLDPSQAGTRVPLTLTKRYTEKLQGGQVTERTEIQQISVLNGSAVNPSFNEVSHMFDKSREPAPRTAIEHQESIAAEEEGVDMAELLAAAGRLRK